MVYIEDRFGFVVEEFVKWFVVIEVFKGGICGIIYDKIFVEFWNF